MSPDILLAASARDWPDRLHRHILDHGGGTIVSRLMGPERAAALSFDVLFIDDVCSFLTPHLVSTVKRGGSEVIGVFASDDGSDAKRRLLECGISDVIEADAMAAEFLSAAATALEHRLPPTEIPIGTSSSRSVGLVGSSDGVGLTEVAVALAEEISATLTAVTLVDLDPTWPSVAQRLDLPLHPNIRSALDASIHRTGQLEAAIHHLGNLDVIGGVADQGSASPIPRHEVLALMEELGNSTNLLVADLGSLRQVTDGLIGHFDPVLLVGRADPVGITRLFRSAEHLLDHVDASRVLLVLNMASRARFHHSEIRREIEGTFGRLPLALLPFDSRIAGDAWGGRPVGRGPFRRSVRQVARLIADSDGQ